MTDGHAAGAGPRWFERRPRLAQALVAVVAVTIALVAIEIGLRCFGVGRPVLYDSNALYGYRPLPNQRLAPLFGPALRFNNLGLRCDEDWDASTAGHVLFLGDSVTYGGNVSNAELFSTLAVHDLPGERGCNAGVNAWGVENIHGLLVDGGFLPAHVYVTVLIEDDFYRGLTRLHGQLLWCRPPGSALAHVLWNLLHLEDERRRYVNWAWYGTDDVVDTVVDKAVRQLVEIDAALAAKGFRHLLYISPTRDQLLHDALRDGRVAATLTRHGVRAAYLADAVKARGLTPSAMEALFYDNVHLSQQGHALWASIINQDLRQLVAAPDGRADVQRDGSR
jgi:hypothetical protein